jgi:hypothetical protein
MQLFFEASTERLFSENGAPYSGDAIKVTPYYDDSNGVSVIDNDDDPIWVTCETEADALLDSDYFDAMKDGACLEYLKFKVKNGVATLLPNALKQQKPKLRSQNGILTNIKTGQPFSGACFKCGSRFAVDMADIIFAGGEKIYTTHAKDGIIVSKYLIK